MQQHKLRPPFAVLDAHVEGRTPDGEWARGPLGSFRLFCSATLFAALAHIEGDDEVKRAAVKTLRYFRPEDALVYRAGAPGTAGYDKEERRVDPDPGRGAAAPEPRRDRTGQPWRSDSGQRAR
ncbi:hypothetical protein Ctob_005990 [Chrysochromulina tobinii]|uniref:Uncharacterized protein n=1 Tax=Chrysochromulina tobinii TaxID=1460289 RepID=A0A0M0JYD8_9EUKA|nr:hypothetical protein Ctob_005990 [Chrysochromulina tobinii]|eukprot:KOO31570.1 hypothetical protein Ctob_005990 [Chrysochromulina sp. CCMP291]